MLCSRKFTKMYHASSTLAQSRKMSLCHLTRRFFGPTLSRTLLIISETADPSQRAISSNIDKSKVSKYNDIIVIGGGIAGLSTARYLLQDDKRLQVTIIDKNDALPYPSPSTTYDKQQKDIMHYNIPSRRNGNVLCPSLTAPWTTRSLWNEVFLPTITRYIKKEENSRPTISFDVPSLLMNKSMWSFAYHFLAQKYMYSNLSHQSNQAILEYNMKCLDDRSDDLIQRIDYGRCAKGTQLIDGAILEGDSSGDIGMFCQGLLHELKAEYRDRLRVSNGEEAITIEHEKDIVNTVTMVGKDGQRKAKKADAIVVACGVASTQLCNNIGIPCPVFPAKGHLATVASNTKCEYNITLHGGIGYAAPMAIKDSEGRYLYRLSGFVDFTSSKETDSNRIEALIDATRDHLGDVILIDASACQRPISADDRPIVGASAKHSNVYLCTGLGSRGWSVGLGCGKLLSRIILELPCEIEPAPFAPNRFR